MQKKREQTKKSQNPNTTFLVFTKVTSIPKMTKIFPKLKPPRRFKSKHNTIPNTQLKLIF